MKWLILCLLAAGIFLALGGCGGAMGLSGGSVPIGDLGGWVFARSRAGVPVANVPVRALAADDTVLGSAHTDSAGHFLFSGLPSGAVRLRAEHTDGTQAWLDLTLAAGESAEAALWLAPDVPNALAVLLAPAEPPTLTIGDTLQFTATVQDAGGGAVDVPVSWAVQGNIGTISQEGLFTAVKQGAGKVHAQYRVLQAEVKLKVRKPQGTQ
jgi:hypothetical protein